MFVIKVKISRLVDDHQPGFVECSFIDAHGTEHFFVEKVPVVTLADRSADGSYPVDGTLGCEVLGSRVDDGTDMVTVSTERPWGIESTEGLLVFDLRSTQLVELSE